jgi:hypothetical protein
LNAVANVGIMLQVHRLAVVSHLLNQKFISINIRKIMIHHGVEYHSGPFSRRWGIRSNGEMIAIAGMCNTERFFHNYVRNTISILAI